MQTSFTDFKLSFSIDNTSNDTEYVNIMSGVLRELYTTFGIALLRDLENNTETINLEHNIETKLIHKNIKSLTISGTLGTYIEGTDYTVNYEDGTITSLSIGYLSPQYFYGHFSPERGFGCTMRLHARCLTVQLFME